jgi:hypothetical protein
MLLNIRDRTPKRTDRGAIMLLRFVMDCYKYKAYILMYVCNVCVGP